MEASKTGVQSLVANHGLSGQVCKKCKFDWGTVKVSLLTLTLLLEQL